MSQDACSSAWQQALKNLGRAFDHCFDKREGNPQYKSKRARQSLCDPQPQEKWVALNGGLM
jgi:transposase